MSNSGKKLYEPQELREENGRLRAENERLKAELAEYKIPGICKYVKDAMVLEGKEEEESCKHIALRRLAERELAELRATYSEFQEKYGITLQDSTEEPGTFGGIWKELQELRALKERLEESPVLDIFPGLYCLYRAYFELELNIRHDQFCRVRIVKEEL